MSQFLLFVAMRYQTFKLRNLLPRGLSLSYVAFTVIILAVQMPLALADSGATVTQSSQASNWRSWFKFSKNKSPSVTTASAKTSSSTGATTISGPSIAAFSTPSIVSAASAATKSSSGITVSAAAVQPSASSFVAPTTVSAVSPSVATSASKAVASAASSPVATSISVTPAPNRFSVAMDDVDVLGPFPSWADAKRDYGAKGDGFSDDAPALQRAINDLGLPGKASVLYLPAGNYKINSTLRLNWKKAMMGFGYPGVSIVGDSPATTKITWAGATGGAMLVQDGVYNTRFSRITWDGQNTAKYGIAHWWNAKAGTFYDGSSEDVDEVFQDMDIGIMGGRLGANYGELNSEGLIRRVTFLRNHYAGLNVGSFNALDWWVFDSHFIDCGRGVSNTFSLGENDAPVNGAGGVYVYRSVFERSQVADFNIGNTGWFSMYENVSHGSRRFFQAEGMGNNAAPVIIKSNRILDTTESVAILDGNLGPLMLIDNQIRSQSTYKTAAVVMNDWVSGRDVLSIGNKYTVSNPIKVVDATDRVISIDDATVAYSAIDGSLPTLPSAPARAAQTVFEVKAGANASEIQAVIDLAAASAATNPIVHLPGGAYYQLENTLEIPNRTRLQIVGDALTSSLMWRGPANQPMIHLKGPSYATVRDISLYAANQAKAILIDGADQIGGRVLIQGSTTGQVKGSNLSGTQLQLQANPMIHGVALSNVKNMVLVACGGLGPVSSTGNSYALIADTWYEGVESSLYRMDSGTFTYMGGMLAPATHSPVKQPIAPTIDFSNFNGVATFVGANFDLSKIPTGVGIHLGIETTSSNVLFLGMAPNTANFFTRDNPKGNVGLLLSKGADSGGRAILAANLGVGDDAFVKSMLAQARALQWDKSVYTPPIGSTNVHIYRVYAPQTLGMEVSGY